MANVRNNESVNVNFDGLTDSVTNLVGALILLVVLLVGITTKAVQKAPTPASVGESQAGQLPVDELLEQVVILQAQLDNASQQVRIVAQQVTDVQRRLAPPESFATQPESSE
ncbi:MAG: hypothetical protein H6822_30410 [Planctomycetaceae bacterium]|nr:hypothetical protein [Planctomycetales bacterium]MCB9926497.1 hypothetical protein [Planctomycetaceae bacterium]